MTQDSDARLEIEVALAKWFEEAKARLSLTQPPLKPMMRIFQDSQGRSGVRTRGQEPYIWSWLEQQRDSLASLPSTIQMTNVLKAIASDDFVAYEQRRWRDADINAPPYVFEQFLRPLLAEHLYAREMVGPTQTEIAAMVELIFDYLNKPQLMFTPSVAVLHNVNLHEPVELQPGIIIRHSTELEQRRWFFEDSPHEPISSFYAEAFGVTRGSPSQVPLVLLVISEDHFAQVQAIAETFIFSCRLFGLDAVGYSRIRQEPSNPIRPRHKSELAAEHGHAHGSKNVDITSGPGQLAINHWRNCMDLREDPQFRQPIYRFGQAFVRGSFDDQIVDLWIALESLFSEQKDPAGDLTYRLCLRVCRLLEQDPERRQKMFDRLKKSYNMRSRVVHGNAERKDKEWEALNKECTQLRDDLRSIFRIATVEGWRPNYPFMDFVDSPDGQW